MAPRNALGDWRCSDDVHIVQGLKETKCHMLRSTAVRALAVATLLLPSSASAQTVLVRVLGADASEPLFGALAYLVDEAGETVRTALTDERGRALFAEVEVAIYRVRAEMIGMATTETELFEVSAGTTVQQALRLESRAIMLEGIEVSAEGGRCRARPEGTGLLVSDVWDEAREIPRDHKCIVGFVFISFVDPLGLAAKRRRCE